MNYPKVEKPSDKSLLIKIRDEYVKPNAKVGTSEYLCSFMSQLADRIEQLETELSEAKAIIEAQKTAMRTEARYAAIMENARLKNQIQDGELIPVEVALSAIQCEPELNDEMPDEMFATMTTSKAGCQLLLRAVVRATKKGITDRLKQFAAERAKGKQ